MSSRLVPSAGAATGGTVATGLVAVRCAYGAERQPKVANANATIAHDQIGLVIFRNAIIGAANAQAKFVRT